MQFRLLGSLEICADDGASVDIGGTQPRLVLAMLLAAESRVVPVDVLIDAIWGDDVPPSASGTLQSYMSRLRRLLTDSRALRWEPPGYRLEVAAEDVDFRHFDELAESGRAALEAGDATAAGTYLTEALALWRGPALHEFADQEFARAVW